MREIETSRPLELEKAYNVRDLGGYANQKGEKLREKRFLRADALSRLTDADWKKLKEYGVVCVVDLRSPKELETAPGIPPENSGIEYHSVPLFDHIQSNDGTQKIPGSLHELYVDLLENSREQISRVLRCFLRYQEGCCLFHCTAGKDRTGVIAMLLLGLAGVDRDTIAADYSVSAGYMELVFAGQREALQRAGYGKAAFLLRSDPEEMHRTLEYVNEKYAGIKPYLQELLNEEELDRLKSRMLG